MAIVSVAILMFILSMLSINYWRKRERKDRIAQYSHTYAEKKYRAVSVRPQLFSCRAVVALMDIRFLAEQAPSFPVRGCDAESCRCQYRFLPDRRDEERRSPFGAARHWLPAVGGDRRSGERRHARA